MSITANNLTSFKDAQNHINTFLKQPETSASSLNRPEELEADGFQSHQNSAGSTEIGPSQKLRTEVTQFVAGATLDKIGSIENEVNASHLENPDGLSSKNLSSTPEGPMQNSGAAALLSSALDAMQTFSELKTSRDFDAHQGLSTLGDIANTVRLLEQNEAAQKVLGAAFLAELKAKTSNELLVHLEALLPHLKSSFANHRETILILTHCDKNSRPKFLLSDGFLQFEKRVSARLTVDSYVHGVIKDCASTIHWMGTEKVHVKHHLESVPYTFGLLQIDGQEALREAEKDNIIDRNVYNTLPVMQQELVEQICRVTYATRRIIAELPQLVIHSDLNSESINKSLGSITQGLLSTKWSFVTVKYNVLDELPARLLVDAFVEEYEKLETAVRALKT